MTEKKWASPFGFTMGQPVSSADLGADVNEERFVMDNGMSAFTSFNPPLPHPLFKEYILFEAPVHGLIQVTARTPVSENDKYGYGVRSNYDRIAAALSKRYGAGSVCEWIADDALWDRPSDWVASIFHSERSHFTGWAGDIVLKEGFSKIYLSIDADSLDAARLSLSYFSIDSDTARKAAEEESDGLL